MSLLLKVLRYGILEFQSTRSCGICTISISMWRFLHLAHFTNHRSRCSQVLCECEVSIRYFFFRSVGICFLLLSLLPLPLLYKWGLVVVVGSMIVKLLYQYSVACYELWVPTVFMSGILLFTFILCTSFFNFVLYFM